MTAGDMVGAEDTRVSFFVGLAMVLEVTASFKRFVFFFEILFFTGVRSLERLPCRWI